MGNDGYMGDFYLYIHVIVKGMQNDSRQLKSAQLACVHCGMAFAKIEWVGLNRCYGSFTVGN